MQGSAKWVGVGVVLLLVCAAAGGVYWLGAERRETAAERARRHVPAEERAPESPPPEEPDRARAGRSERAAAAEQESLRAPPDAPPLPPPPEAQFVNKPGAAEYIGAERCAACHAEEYASYVETTHFHSFREADAASAPEDGTFDDPVSGRAYRVYRDGEKLHHVERIAVGDKELSVTDHPVAYVVGSGNHARTYLVEVDGFLAESPITWFTSRGGWALSPGYEKYNSGFARPVYFECLYCHTGRVEARDGIRSQPVVHTASIDCERCHGPGSLHAEKWSGAAELVEFDSTIVHPGKLPRAVGEDVCAQCHLHGIATVDVRGRKMSDFHPGHSLAEFHLNYALQAPNKEMKVVGHVEQMRLSRCYEASGTLTCTTCHDPHVKPPTATRAEYFKAKCISCHDEAACGLPRDERLQQSAEDNCVACHMPTSDTEVRHVAATHHRIGIHRKDQVPRSAAGGQLVPLADVSHLPELEQQRCLGVAYLKASQAESRPDISETYRKRARQLLEMVHEQGIRDPDTLTSLALIALIDDPPQTVQRAEAALRSPQLTPVTEVEALHALSQAYVKMRQPQLARAPLERLVKLRRQAGDWFLLAICRWESGEIEPAVEAAREAADIMPDQPNFQQLLAEIYRSARDEGRAAEYAERAELLRSLGTPKDASAPSGAEDGAAEDGNANAEPPPD